MSAVATTGGRPVGRPLVRSPSRGVLSLAAVPAAAVADGVARDAADGEAAVRRTGREARVHHEQAVWQPRDGRPAGETRVEDGGARAGARGVAGVGVRVEWARAPP